MSRRREKLPLVALGASLLVHVAAFVGLVGEPAPPRPHVASGELVSFEVVLPTPPAPAPAPERPLEPAPPPAARPRPRTTPPPPPALPRDDAPRGAPADPEPPPPPRLTAPSLLPSSSFVLALDAGVAAPDDAPAGLRAPPRPDDLVGALAKETLGRGRVDRGLVHPYYSQLGKALLKTWDADRVAKSGLKGLTEQTAQNMKLYNDIWLERAAAYGGSGNPMGEVAQGTNRRAPVNDRIQGLPGVDLEARKELSKQMREQFKATRRAVIRVVQDAAGRLVKVELVQPSQDAKVDREALVDVRRAAEALPPPPSEALEGKAGLSSLWSFELVVSISPPVPTFTFEFDEALGFVDVRLPLDRRIYKKVRLVAVE